MRKLYISLIFNKLVAANPLISIIHIFILEIYETLSPTSILPTHQLCQFGGRDVHAVLVGEEEEVFAESGDFVGVDLVAVGGEIVEEGVGFGFFHVAGEGYGVAVEYGELLDLTFL